MNNVPYMVTFAVCMLVFATAMYLLFKPKSKPFVEPVPVLPPRVDMVFIFRRLGVTETLLIEKARLRDMPTKLPFICDYIVDMENGLYLKSRSHPSNSVVPESDMEFIKSKAVRVEESDVWLLMTDGKFSGKGELSDATLAKMRKLEEETGDGQS